MAACGEGECRKFVSDSLEGHTSGGASLCIAETPSEVCRNFMSFLLHHPHAPLMETQHFPLIMHLEVYCDALGLFLKKLVMRRYDDYDFTADFLLHARTARLRPL